MRGICEQSRLGGWWCAFRYTRTRDGDLSWLRVVWCGASCGTSCRVNLLMVPVVKLVVVDGCSCVVSRAEGDSRIGDEGDEEKACSEFWSGYLRVVQS